MLADMTDEELKRFFKDIPHQRFSDIKKHLSIIRRGEGVAFDN
jgi:hypothetical protein